MVEHALVLIVGHRAGELTADFPFGEQLNAAKPHITYMEGWKVPTSACRRFADLPAAARAYVDYIERAIDREIKYISVGAERDSIIIR